MMLVVLVSAVLALAAAPKKGRLQGHVDVGPISPLERPGVKPSVPVEMYKRCTVSITQPGPHNGQMKSHLLRVVAQLKPNARGDYSVDLEPGSYQVSVTFPGRAINAEKPKEVTIASGKTVKLNLKVDTGIR